MQRAADGGGMAAGVRGSAGVSCGGWMNGWMLADDARIVRAVLSITAPARSSVPFLSARWLHRRPTPGAAALDAPLVVPRAGVVQALRQAKQAECCSYNARRFGLGVGPGNAGV